MNGKNPGVASVLCFVLPGLGFIYLGRLREGFFYIVGILISWAFIWSEISDRSRISTTREELVTSNWIILFLLLVSTTIWILGIWASYKTAQNMNQKATKICNLCAETIKADAVVCRYCGAKLQEEPIGVKSQHYTRKKTLDGANTKLGA